MIEFNPKKIRQRRKAAGLTANELAKRAGITRQTLDIAERGRRQEGINITTFVKIMNALGETDPGLYFSPINLRNFDDFTSKSMSYP